MTPTPEQLAAAEAIDAKRYDGHTPWPWRWLGGRLIQTAHITRDVWNVPRVDPDLPLIEDSPLIPALVHQRDEERRKNAALEAERDAAREQAKHYKAALETIRTGKIHADNEHPLGEWASMGMRFHEIAREALRATGETGEKGANDGNV